MTEMNEPSNTYMDKVDKDSSISGNGRLHIARVPEYRVYNPASAKYNYGSSYGDKDDKSAWMEIQKQKIKN